MTDHSGQKAGSKLLAAIFYDGLARTVIQRDVTPLAALGIEVHGNRTLRAKLKNPVYEFSAFHVLQNRT